MSGPPLPSELRTLVVILPSWIGDTVMATPVLRALRRERPAARIIGVMRPGLEEILDGTPWLDDRVVAATKTLAGVIRVRRRVSAIARRPDACLVLPNSFRGALVARLAGARRRAGYARSMRSALLTAALAPPRRRMPVPAIDYYADLAAWALGAPVEDRRPELGVTPAQRAAADALLEGVAGPTAVLVPGANRADKRWPAERFAAVAAALRERGLAAVAAGSPGERGVVRAVRDAPGGGGVVDLVERGLTLGALKGVIERACLVVTNDTGPRHLAVALGTPVVALFGPTDHRWTTTASPREQVLLAEPFLPQDLVADRCARACAISRIPAADVLAACERLLAAAAETAARGRGAEGASRPPAGS